MLQANIIFEQSTGIETLGNRAYEVTAKICSLTKEPIFLSDCSSIWDIVHRDSAPLVSLLIHKDYGAIVSAERLQDNGD